MAFSFLLCCRNRCYWCHFLGGLEMASHNYRRSYTLADVNGVAVLMWSDFATSPMIHPGFSTTKVRGDSFQGEMMGQDPLNKIC